MFFQIWVDKFHIEVLLFLTRIRIVEVYVEQNIFLDDEDSYRRFG